MHTKRKREQLLRLRFPGIAKHLTTILRVKAHASSVSIPSFTPGSFFNFGELGKPDSSGRFNFYMSIHLDVYFIRNRV
jgi:hypothetical protein